MSTLPVRGHK